MPSRLPHRILHALVPTGLRTWLRGSLRRPKRSNAPPAAELGPTPPRHPFDLEFGTDTGGLIPGEELATGTRSDRWNTAYYGVSPSLFNQALSALTFDLSRFTFIDLGSGKGRALLLAARLPFRGIVGVELSPELSTIAAANIALFAPPWQRCHQLEAQTGDAAQFAFPPGPLVIFLYHPFLSPVLKRCLGNLAASLKLDPREVYLVYVNPMLQDLLKRVPNLEKVWERTFPYSAEDVSVDRLGGTGDRVALWRYLPQAPAVPVP